MRKFLVALVFLFSIPLHAMAGTIAIRSASLEADHQKGWSLNISFDFELNSSLKDALQRGVALYFKTEFKLTHPQWYWFIKRKLRTSQTFRLSYQPLTREYRISSGGLHLSFSKLEDSLKLLQNISAWHVIDRAMIKPDQLYLASVRMELDVSMLAKPLQINALNNRDWELSSDWKEFSFTASQNE